MNKSLSIFAIITAVCVVLAWFVVDQRSPTTLVEKVKLYPDLASKIQDVTHIEIKSNDQTALLTTKDNTWVLENQGNYPASFNRIRPLVLAISALEIREAKTANPERYARLQVEDVTQEKAKSNQVTLKDTEGNVIADLLIGKERMNKTTGSVDSLYVRKIDDPQSYLVRGSVVASADPADWLDNKVVDFAADRLKSITIDHGDDKTVKLTRSNRDDVDYTLENIPEGYKTKSQTTIKSSASAIQGLRFDDVTNLAAFTWPESIVTTTYETFDGFVVTVKSALKDEKVWANFSISANDFDGDEEAKKSLEEELKTLRDRTEAWVYALPTYKADQLRRELDDLIVEEGVELPPEPASAPPGMMPPGGLPEGFPPGMQGMMPPQQ